MSQTILDVVSIVAIISGPLIALALQRRVEDRREKRKLKLEVFRSLMMYRATPLSPSYVQALNQIDVVFHGDNGLEKAVRDAWSTLLDHLTYYAQSQMGEAEKWEKTRTLTSVLLAAMGKCLGFEFNDVYLRRHAYHPQALTQLESDQIQLRTALLNVLVRGHRIPVAIFPDQFDPLRLPPEGEHRDAP
jgi:hypothetical protein